MKYRIRHVSSYHYSAPVSVCHNFLMLTPREGGRVHSLSHRLVIRPTPLFSSRRTDSFGNTVHSFAIEENHRQLAVTATSHVDVAEARPPEKTPPWETVVGGVVAQTDPDWLEACRFAFDSPRISRAPEFADYAIASFVPERPILDAAFDLTKRIHEDFEYDKAATSVGTPTREAFDIRKGVCQDFAHVQISCLRSLGVPARYVSGYLRTVSRPGQPRIVGADQSHAWLAVYCGAAGWVEVDPTNACLSSQDHIPIAWGRDYDDVVPVKGVVLGGGDHQLSVSVDVESEDDASEAARP